VDSKISDTENDDVVFLEPLFLEPFVDQRVVPLKRYHNCFSFHCPHLTLQDPPCYLSSVIALSVPAC
jgi:hypothetical protein